MTTATVTKHPCKVEPAPGVFPDGRMGQRGWRAFCWRCGWISHTTGWYQSACAMRNQHAYDGCRE